VQGVGQAETDCAHGTNNAPIVAMHAISALHGDADQPVDSENHFGLGLGYLRLQDDNID
jgi:hypothetical protein